MFFSPLKRSLQACEIIGREPIIHDDRLVEIICGEFEGAEETPDMMKQFWRAASEGDRGVEKIDDFLIRSFDFCDMISNDYKSKNVLIVTHAANARAIIYYFSGKPDGYDFTRTLIKGGELIMFES